MFELNQGVLDYLNGGGTLVVPTRQRAVAMRLAHTAAQLRAQLRCWNTPDILSWQAWLERSLDVARARGAVVPRRLRKAEEWLLWRDAVRRACVDFDILLPDDLVDAVRQAVNLSEDFGIRPAPGTSPEATVFVAARRLFEARCQELDVLSLSHWSRCLSMAAPLVPARLLGFDRLGPRRRETLDRYGVRPWSDADGEISGAGTVRVIGAVDPVAEIRAAAHWCRERLQLDGRARLLVVLPQLRQQRHEVVRAFGNTLGGSQTPPSYAIEGGQPLADYAIVTAALSLIELASGPLEFTRFSAVLRSPYWRVGSEWQRLRMDLWLREQPLQELELATLRHLLPLLRARRDTSVADVCEQLIVQLPPASAVDVSEPHSVWARRFAALLAACGWPGDTTLGSAEQQQLQRFEELLGEFAAVGVGAGSVTGGEACSLLQRLAATTAFEPASDDVAVTITAARVDPIVHYDGIWVAGLSADSWPPQVAPDPLLPVELQRATGVPAVSAAGQLQRAHQALAQWRRASTQLVLSWPTAVDSVARDPSALLRPFMDPLMYGSSSLPAAPQLALWLQQQRQFEVWHDDRATPWVAQHLPGGTRVLELQALCPFRAHAQLRLHAVELHTPAPGIDPRLRGQLLHEALEQFWRETTDSAALQALTQKAEAARVHACIDAAAQRLMARSAVVLPPLLWQQELRRAALLMSQLLEYERQREPFHGTQVEVEGEGHFGGRTLSLRFDRIDRLDDGGLVVIDYKSGAIGGFDAYVPRPPRPQLPAYALGAGTDTPVVAVAMAYLGREGARWRGFSDRSGRLQGVPAPKDGQMPWPQLLQQWQAQLDALVDEFVTGHAPVQPLGRACEHCHLQLLCRIGPNLAFDDVEDSGDAA